MAKFFIGLLVALAIFIGLPAAIYMGTYNGLQKRDETVSQKEQELNSCYLKRSGLYNNMVGAAREAAGSEKEITVGYAQARSDAPVLPTNPTDKDREAFAEAQKAANAAIAKFKAAVEAVPNIKSNAAYLKAQKEFSDTEKQCNFVRVRYIATIADFNKAVRSFPTNMIAGMHGISVRKQIDIPESDAPKVAPNMFPAKK